MHMMLQHARLFLANRSVTIETLLRLNSPQIAFVDSWAMARSTFCVQDWDLTALMSGPPTHTKKKHIKIKKKHEKNVEMKKKNVELRWKPERNRRIALRSHCKTHQTNQVVSSGRWRQEWLLEPNHASSTYKRCGKPNAMSRGKTCASYAYLYRLILLMLTYGLLIL